MSMRNFQMRTDLALEEKERFPGDGGEIGGVALREWHRQDEQIKISEVMTDFTDKLK